MKVPLFVTMIVLLPAVAQCVYQLLPQSAQAINSRATAQHLQIKKAKEACEQEGANFDLYERAHEEKRVESLLKGYGNFAALLAVASHKL